MHASTAGLNFFSDELPRDTGAKVASGDISNVIGIYSRKLNQGPLNNCAMLIALARLIRGNEAGPVELAALSIRTLNSSGRHLKTVRPRLKFANDMLESGVSGNVDALSDAGEISRLTGCRTSFTSMRTIRSGLAPLVLWRKYNHPFVINKSVMNERNSIEIFSGESAYSGLTLVLDTLIEAGKGALFAKPKIGFMMAANLSWTVGKKITEYSAEKKAVATCRKMRLDGFYKRSLAALDRYC